MLYFSDVLQPESERFAHCVCSPLSTLQSHNPVQNSWNWTYGIKDEWYVPMHSNILNTNLIKVGMITPQKKWPFLSTKQKLGSSMASANYCLLCDNMALQIKFPHACMKRSCLNSTKPIALNAYLNFTDTITTVITRYWAIRRCSNEQILCA